MRLSLLKWIILPLLAVTARGACAQPAADLQKAAPSPVKKRPLLTLPDVFALVLERNPDLAVYGADVRIQAARVIQAGLRPNPELQTEVENIGGTGELGIINSAETTLLLSQRFELGGKRRLRIQSAEKERDLAARTLLVQEAGLLAIGADFFIEMLAAQQRLANREQLFDLARRIHVTVSARVAAGKVSPIEESRSTVTLESARLEMDKSAKALLAARERLAALWQGAADDFVEARAAFSLPPGANAVFSDAGFVDNAELKQAQAAMESRKASLASEIAGRKPDITLGAGLRHFSQFGEIAWVANVTLPLPLFDKRQGLIAEASSRVEKAAAEQRALENRLKVSLTLARRQGEAALQEAKSLADNILPAAQNALDSLQEGYRQGKFDYLAVLDAQRTYFELKGRQIDAVAQALKAAAQLRYLTGRITQPDAFAFMDDPKERPHE